MYTKGKWEITNIDGNTYITSHEYEIAKLCIKPTPVQTFRSEEIKANAERICCCVNSHDALLEACKESLKDLIIYQANARDACKTDKRWEGVAEAVQPTVDKIRGAISETK